MLTTDPDAIGCELLLYNSESDHSKDVYKRTVRFDFVIDFLFLFF
jgi:hypothetical protein